MRGVLVFSIAILLGGCASLSTPTLDPATGSWREIQQSGISTDASYTLIPQKVNVTGDAFFEPGEEKISWWGLFGSFTFWSQASFLARWYDPAGNLFWEEEFGSGQWNFEFAKTSIPLAGSPAAELPGLWRVEIHHKGRLIDRKQFQVLSVKPPVPPSAGMTPQMMQLSETWTKAPLVPPGPGDIVFQERFEKAAARFHARQYDDARLILNEILREEPFRTEAHLALAAIYFRELKWEESLHELDYVMQNPAYRDQALEMQSVIREMKGRAGSSQT